MKLFLIFSLALPVLAQTKMVTPFDFPPYTVATLPAAASYTNKAVMVTDGVQPGTCTTAGGSGHTLCWSNGSAWVPIGIPYSGATIAGTWTGSTINAPTMGATNQFYGGASPAKIVMDNGGSFTSRVSAYRDCWVSGTNVLSGFDLGFARAAANRVEVNNCTAGTLADLTLRSLVAGGTSPTVTPGTIGTGSRNAAGFITSGTTGTFTPVLTFNGTTAPLGWTCGVSNNTTANLIRQTAYTTTTATFEGVTVSGDVITYNCTAF